MLKTPRASALTALATLPLILLSACSDGSSGTAEEPASTPASASASSSPTAAAVPTEEPTFAELPGAEIRQAAADAMAEAGSFHVVGESQDGDSAVTFDISLNADGDCVGEVGVDDGTMKIRRRGEDTWIRASDTFWRNTVPDQADILIEAVDGRWVVLPEASVENFAYFCNMDGLFGPFIGRPSATSTFDVTEVRQVDGQDVAVVQETAGGSQNRVLVQVDEPHHVVQIENGPAGEDEVLRLTEIGTPVRVPVPAGDEVVDLSE